MKNRYGCKRWAEAIVIGIALFSIENAACQAELLAGGKERIDRAMIIESSSFYHQGEIPPRHTCDGQNISPALNWAGVPAVTRSFALIVDDPDAPDPAAPQRTWVHWILYNIPAGTNGLPEGVADKELPDGTLQGVNDWKSYDYGGPCPPVGKHRYFHKLFALDVVFPDLKYPGKAMLEKAMHGHILAHTSLIGLYQRR